jgi:hypothetical protein
VIGVDGQAAAEIAVAIEAVAEIVADVVVEIVAATEAVAEIAADAAVEIVATGVSAGDQRGGRSRHSRHAGRRQIGSSPGLACGRLRWPILYGSGW